MRRKFDYKKYQWILIPLGILVAWKAYKIYTGARDTGKKVVADIKESVQIQAVQAAVQNANISPIRSEAVIDIAETIYEAIWKYMWGSMEDEVAAMAAFNSLTSAVEARACASIYKANFKKSLYSDITKYCHYSDFDGMKTSYLNATKGI